MTPSKFEVGQKVVCVNSRMRAIETTLTPVTRVGRKYAYVIPPYSRKEVPFDLVDGREQTNYDLGSRIWLPSEWVLHQRRVQYTDNLREVGISFSTGMRRPSLELLRRILNLAIDAEMWEQGFDD